MQPIFRTIFKCIRTAADGDQDASERFLRKSENFRLLLAANNRTLEVMAEMNEDAWADRRFGMSHVRAQCLKAASGVRQMIERLCLMRPGKYEGLKDAFNRILQDVERTLSDRARRSSGPLVMDMRDIRAEASDLVGAKMAHLGEIAAALGMEVPSGFAVTAPAFHLFMERTGLEDEINRLIQISGGDDLEELRMLEADIHHAIDMTALPSELGRAVETACKSLLEEKKNMRLAVRSSALGEDSRENSFAGQFVSLLGVHPAGIAEAYRSVVAGLFSATAMTYRLNRGLREDAVVMCVGCMEMIHASAGGVIYTRPPLGDDDGTMMVSAVPGLPCGIVDGSSEADSWKLHREDLKILETRVACKQCRYFQAPDGRISREGLAGSDKEEPSIPECVVVELGGMARRIEDHFGVPQDIEWAMEPDGRITILQCRPLSVCEGREPGVPPADMPEDGMPALLSSCIAASPGVGAGRVVRIDARENIADFPEGAVLLARNARPQLSALLPRAAALVAEFGSAVGHLANVAREYGIPALIGAPGAVETLGGVGVVTVNADAGAVFLGCRQERVDAAGERHSAARVSDVVQALRRVLPKIVSLTLTDPDSFEFRPENCLSLHDITRYCHEMSVVEMFMQDAAPISKARMLNGGLPMQYWLVDIGGGTLDSCEGRHVRLDEIRSNAMLALWTGMTAVPWEGPPPVDAGGFMSVVFQASQNPALSPGLPNSMGERNYFMVGRHYCNLQSRFGFHFCTVEGFAGNDPGENHVLFQFKGGGADMGRRMVRARLISEILERHGFIVEMKDDSLFARVEGIATEAVEQALAISGYLLVHTRQIDMVMASTNASAGYREKFSSDIRTVLSRLREESPAWRGRE